MRSDVSNLCLSPEDTLETALRTLDSTGRGCVLVVDEAGRLMATLTDGDARRAILRGIQPSARIRTWLIDLQRSVPPTTAPVETPLPDLLSLMRAAGVRHIPLIDDEQRPAGLASVADLLAGPVPSAGSRALVMAGGKGTRMHPLTLSVPKPMLSVGDRPIIERLMERLRITGIRRVSVSLHHMADHIRDFLGNGERFGVDIDYVQEEVPRGTAGALALIDESDEPVLVINADILTTVDFRAMMDFHQEHQAALTVAVRNVEVDVPYGVIEVEGTDVRSVVEKPRYSYFANAGIYVVEARVYRMVPNDRHYDMTELIEKLCTTGEKVAAFPIFEYWRDVGRPEDYASAQLDSAIVGKGGAA